MSIAANLPTVLFDIDIREDYAMGQLEVIICGAEPSCPVHKMGFFTLREGVDKIRSICLPDETMIFKLNSNPGFHMVVMVLVDIIMFFYAVDRSGKSAQTIQLKETMKDGVLFVELRLQDVNTTETSIYRCEIHATRQVHERMTRTPLRDNLLHEASYNKKLGVMLKRMGVPSSSSGNSDDYHVESPHGSSHTIIVPRVHDLHHFGRPGARSYLGGGGSDHGPPDVEPRGHSSRQSTSSYDPERQSTSSYDPEDSGVHSSRLSTSSYDPER
jgi:hypothetical protein